MTVKELLASLEQWQAELAAMSERCPKCSRVGPGCHNDPERKVIVNASSEVNGIKVHIGMNVFNGGGVQLTSSQCEWLRDVLMEWFPKEAHK